MRAKRRNYYVELVTWLASCGKKLSTVTKGDDQFTTTLFIGAVTGAYVSILHQRETSVPYFVSFYLPVANLHSYLLFRSRVI
jgi:hypothetical protein